MIWIATSGITLISLVGLVYLLYFFFILRNNKSITNFEETINSIQNSNSDLKPVSFIVSAFNEAKVIGRKMKNISELDYPKEKIEILVLDDHSSDGTGELAKEKIKELNLSGRIIRNPSRIGLNRSLNLAMKEATHNFICVSDSDVILEKNALKNAVAVLQKFEDAGGVTGNLKLIADEKNISQATDKTYRGFYDKSMLGESSVHSSFPGNGTLMIFDKSKVPYYIPEDYGATDANIAMNVIKSGLRFIYVPNSIIFEHIPETLSEQRMQKVRRAKRLIQVFTHNLDILLNKKYGSFGKKIFPLKLFMVTLCPILLFSGLILFSLSIIISQNLLLYLLSIIGIASVITLLLFSKNLKNILLSFIFHQVYLFIGFFSSFQKSKFWKNIERK